MKPYDFSFLQKKCMHAKKGVKCYLRGSEVLQGFSMILPAYLILDPTCCNLENDLNIVKTNILTCFLIMGQICMYNSLTNFQDVWIENMTSL